MSISANKLSQLTREEKVRLAELLQEKKRRLATVRNRFKPNDGQLEIWKSKRKQKALFCGNGFGKTTFGVIESFCRANGYNYVTNEYFRIPRKVVVVLDKPEKVADKWLPEIKKWWTVKEDQLHKNGKPYFNEITFENGSQLKFMFHEQDPLSFESMECDDVIYDEPPPRNVYISLARGQRNEKLTDQSTLILATPLTGSWLRREIYEPWAKGELTDTDCFKFSSRVNEDNLPPGYIEWFESKLSEKERRIRIEGDFFDLDGQALAHLFKRNTHIVDAFDWPREWPTVIAIDPHPEKAHVCVLVGADEVNRIYAIKELAIKLPPRQFGSYLAEWCSNYRVTDIVVDSLGSADLTGGDGFKSFITVVNEELAKFNLRCRPTTWEEKGEDAFVARMQDALLIPSEEDNFGQKIPKLRIFRNCTGLISDIENVQWAKDRLRDENKPKLEMSNKDFLSALKYALATNVNFKKGTARVVRRPIPETYTGKRSPSLRFKLNSRFTRKRAEKDDW